MLKVRERKDGTVVIDSGRKGKNCQKIDWKGMLGNKLPGPKLAITLKRPRGRPAKYAGKDEELIADAKRRIGASRKNAKPITDRLEFARACGPLYDELCRRKIQHETGLPKKPRKGKYKSMGNEKRIEAALGMIAVEKIRNVRAFCGQHRFLYNHLSKGKNWPCKKLSKMENKIILYARKYAKKRGILDEGQLSAAHPLLYKAMHGWKLLDKMKYGKPAASAEGKAPA